MQAINEIGVDEISEAMYQMVLDSAGKKNLKAGDLTRAMIGRFGENRCSKEDCKQAIRRLIDAGRCIYSYYGASYIQLPDQEAAVG